MPMLVHHGVQKACIACLLMLLLLSSALPAKSSTNPTFAVTPYATTYNGDLNHRDFKVYFNVTNTRSRP